MCFLCLGYFGWAQTQYSYYLVEETGSSLEPQSKIKNLDGTLSLSFTNSSLNSFFQNKTIYKYEKAFPNEASAYLQRIYKTTLSDSTYLSYLENLDNIEHAEQVTEGEGLLEPNDAYYVNDNLYSVSNLNKSQLNLIRAPKAWDITTGNPNIIVGVVDTYFSTTDETQTIQMELIRFHWFAMVP